MKRLSFPSLGGLLILAVLTSACIGVTPVSFDLTYTPIQTSTQTATLPPSLTPFHTTTATLTASPAPTATRRPGTPTHTPLVLGKVESIPEAGFAFRPVEGYEIKRDSPEQVTLFSPDGSTIVSMSSLIVRLNDPIEDFLQRFLDTLAERFGRFFSGDPYPIEIDKKAGLATDVSGLFAGQNIEGQVVLIPSGQSRLFSAVGIVVNPVGNRSAGSEGKKAIQAIINSVDFIEPDE